MKTGSKKELIKNTKTKLLNSRNCRDLSLKLSQNWDLLRNRIQHIKVSPERYLSNLFKNFPIGILKKQIYNRACLVLDRSSS